MTAKENDSALQNWRDQIDMIDVELLNLLARRMEKVRLIGQYKKQHTQSLLSRERQQVVLRNWLQIAEKLDMSPTFVTQLYRLIHDFSLKIEADE